MIGRAVWSIALLAGIACSDVERAPTSSAAGSGSTAGGAASGGAGTGGEAGDASAGAAAGHGGQGGSKPNLKPCESYLDCPNPTAVCEQGYCCAGHMIDGECRCGDAP